MYSDTHFHFRHMQERGLDGIPVLLELCKNDTFFALDIGTKSDDYSHRRGVIAECVGQLDEDLRKKLSKIIHFSAGIWPDVDSIKDRYNKFAQMKAMMSLYKTVAIGECGIDHHWNPSGADGRCESDFSKSIYEGEKELFSMQIELAKSLNLPVIVHSRDAFSDTLWCIDESNYHNGIIHCFSYGIDEAKQFLDRGWYIALGGAVTYTKKRDMDLMHKLINYIPKDRLLLETDAPYLAPVPFRGKINSPVLIKHTYDFIAEHRSISTEELCETVDSNIKTLFTKNL